MTFNFYLNCVVLSILIPIFNYNASLLVHSLHAQASLLGYEFEIICLDDTSTIKFDDNLKLNTLVNCQYIFLDNNIGRSAIRNKLARLAKYDYLLFIDSDMLVKNANYIANYLNSVEGYDIVYGGISYEDTVQNDSLILRWKYGIKRESLNIENRNVNPYLSAKFCNLLIRKKIFDSIRFDEKIIEYGHEDTLFSIKMQELKLKVLHIENELTHLGLEDSQTYLKKVKIASVNLRRIYEMHHNRLLISEIPLLKTYYLLKRFYLVKPYQLLYKLFSEGVERNLLSKDPNILLLDFYKLNSICSY